MKKSGAKICVLFLICAFFALFLYQNNFCFVWASKSTPDVREKTLQTYNFDTSLFEAVLSMATQLNCNQTVLGKGFDLDLFLENYNDTNIPSYISSNTADDDYADNVNARNEIVNDLKLGKLNLTTGVNAKYDCLKEVSPIKNITGLNSMNLGFVKELILDDNNISVISSTDFNSLSNLQTLSIKNNSLTAISLNSKLNKVENLNLSNNLISSVDLTVLPNNSKVDLSKNSLSDFTSLTLPSIKNLNTLNLNFNKLTNLTQNDLSNLQLRVSNLTLGVQGINEIDTFYAGDKIKIYNLSCESLNKLSVIAQYFEGNDKITKSDFYSNENSNIICSTANLGEQTLFLPAGKIKLVFKNNNSLIDLSVYSEFAPQVILSKLPNLNYLLTSNGKTVETTYQDNDINIKFFVENNTNLSNLQDVLDNTIIYSKVGNNSNFSQLDNLTINTNGTFTCTSYAVFDGIKSNEISINLTRKNIKGIVLGLIIIISIFILGSTGYCLTKWYKSGAEVAPLSEKELAKLNYRRNKQKKETRENFIKGFGASRHFEAKGTDDEVLTDLNTDEKVGYYYNHNEKSDYENSNIENDVNFNNNFEKYNQEEYKNEFKVNDENEDFNIKDEINDFFTDDDDNLDN